MTRAEFDVWVEQHYGELVAVAKKRARDGSPDEVLQAALVAMLESTALDRTPLTLAWPWAVGFIRYKAKDARVSRARRQAALSELRHVQKASAPIHGRKRPAPRAE